MLPVSPSMGVYICVIGTDGHTCIYLYLLDFKLSMLSAGSTCIRYWISSDSLRDHVHRLLWLESMSTTLDLQAQFLTLVPY